jgi:hypothetical protein
MILPEGYALSRNQAPINKTFRGWWSSVIRMDEARCVFTIEENGRELKPGNVIVKDAAVVEEVCTNFIYLHGQMCCYRQIAWLCEVMENTKLTLRLSTKVNAGAKQGATMWINGGPSIIEYMKRHILSDDAYLAITNGTN